MGVYQLGLKRRRSFDVPVLGIGNLEIGGLGKTPAAIAVANLLRGKKIAVSCNAYGSPSASSARLVAGEINAREHGDEACLIRRKSPEVSLILGRDRVRAAEIAAAERFDALILDDGFQHLPLARRRDVVIWNPHTRNRRLLPAGPFREPVSGARRADAFFMDERAATPFKKQVFFFRRVFRSVIDLRTGQRLPAAWLLGRTITAACGIAKPDVFFSELERIGATIEKKIAVLDHVAPDLGAVRGECVVTEKDAVKLDVRTLGADVYALEMDIEFCEQEAVVDWLTQTLFRF